MRRFDRNGALREFPHPPPRKKYSVYLARWKRRLRATAEGKRRGLPSTWSRPCEMIRNGYSYRRSLNAVR